MNIFLKFKIFKIILYFPFIFNLLSLTFSEETERKQKNKYKLTYALELNFSLKDHTTTYRHYIEYQISEKYKLRLIFREIDQNADFDIRLYYKINENSSIYIGESNKYFSFNYTYKLYTNYPISIESTFTKHKDFIQVNPAIKIELNDNFHLKYGVNNITRSPNPYLRPSFIFRF